MILKRTKIHPDDVPCIGTINTVSRKLLDTVCKSTIVTDNNTVNPLGRLGLAHVARGLTRRARRPTFVSTRLF